MLVFILFDIKQTLKKLKKTSNSYAYYTVLHME